MKRTASWLLLTLLGCEAAPDLDDVRTEASSSTTDPLSAPTWYDDVGPLMMDSCSACHTAGGVGSFSMDTYEEAQPWAAAIAASLEAGTMPPWAAVEDPECTPEVWFKDDPRLTPEQIATVRAWADAGAPAGEERPLARPGIDHIAEPSATLRLNEPFTVSGSKDIYQCFRIELPTDTDVWLTEMEVLADNDAVVHHVLVWSDPSDLSASLAGSDGSYSCGGDPGFFAELLGGWTPGSQPIRNPEGTGSPLKAGGTVVVNVHYHPTDDTSEVDQTEIAMKWITEQPAQHATYFMVDMPFGAQPVDGEFLIPAGVPDHVEELSLTIPDEWFIPPLTVFSVMPHMHYRGTHMKVWLEREDEPDECIVQADGFRFDFQTIYTYDTPDLDALPTALPGDTIKVRCQYDNSWNNPFMQEALDAASATDLIDVRWGEETGDEMCMAVVGLIIPPIDLSDWL